MLQYNIVSHWPNPYPKWFLLQEQLTHSSQAKLTTFKQYDYHIHGLMQERCNSTANTLQLHLSCTNPSTSSLVINIGRWFTESVLICVPQDLAVHINIYSGNYSLLCTWECTHWETGWQSFGVDHTSYYHWWSDQPCMVTRSRTTADYHTHSQYWTV